MTKELDELMDKRAKEYSDKDIDTIIRDIRKQLAYLDAGIKPQKKTEDKVKVQGVLEAFIQRKTNAPAVKKMNRRI